MFEVTFGLPTPTVFVLTPSSSLESLLAIETGLERDDVFMKAASPYLDAPAIDPVYVRQELSLLTAFANVPRIEIPAATAAKGPRIFECARMKATTSGRIGPRSGCSRSWAKWTSSARSA